MGRKALLKNQQAAPTRPQPAAPAAPNWPVLILSLVGIALTGYLLWADSSGSRLQGGGVDSGCDAVLSSRWATLLGVPTAFWGLLAYGTLAGLAWRWGAGWRWIATWTVALLGVEWIDECEDSLGSAAPVVAFDVRFEVIEGAVSIIPLTDFAFIMADGISARVGLLSTCAKPPLDYTIISAGAERRGRIAVQLPAGSHNISGELTYGQLGVLSASWKVSDSSIG